MNINIVDKDGNDISSTDATVPNNRDFRNAWSLSGTVITEDLETAKIIFANAIRDARTPLLLALDTDYMRALEASQNTTSIIASKQELRDAPTAGDSATTISELKSAWPSCCGASPYEET